MIKNYFKVALRYLLRYKGYTLINILGLSTGIACCILIMLFVRSEFSYDRFHTRSARIARAWVDEKAEGKPPPWPSSSPVWDCSVSLPSPSPVVQGK